MAEDTKVLQDTVHSGYYGASYAQWKNEAAELIASYQSVMSGLNSVRITGHEVLASGVRMTVYENGARVFVNYTQQDYAADGVTVPARSYLVTGGDAQ